MKNQLANNWVRVSEEGFSIKLSSGIINIRWDEVKEIYAYKLDLMTIDEICFDIVLSETVITLSEEIEGWQIFTDKLETVVTGFDKEWFAKVVYPAFKTNYTRVYYR
jgi:hypothetical protein